jgi:hypothetical protein
MAEEKRALAAHLASGPSFSETRGDGWMLLSDVDKKRRDTAIEAIDFARRGFRTAFPDSPQVPPESPATILLYRDESILNRITAFDNLSPQAGYLAGEYTVWDRMVYVSAADDLPAEMTFNLVVHEFTHHLTFRGLYQGRKPPPHWIAEGIAEFVETIWRDENGAIKLEFVDRRLQHMGTYAWRPPAQTHLMKLKKTVEEERLPDLESVLSYERGGSDSDEMLMRDVSWLFVHYLINGDESRHREAFTRWVMEPAGDNSPSSLEKALGRPLAEIDARLRAYIEEI